MASGETKIINEILLMSSQLGHRLFRNNSGQHKTTYKGNDRWIKYGIANPGGSDLLGWTNIPYKNISFAIFTAVEVKTKGLKPTTEQTNFINIVRELGGIAILAYSVDDYIVGLKEYIDNITGDL